jgi:phosphatidylglycerophosphatase A
VTRLAILICSFGYLGYIPFAPGTIGSAAGLGVLYGLRAWTRAPWVEPLAIVLLFVAGAWSGTRAEAYFGTTDPGQGIIDEVMGMLVTVLFIPVHTGGAIAGFVLFRIFDVIKPYPASRLERLPGGAGMMADDAMAAVYANVSLRLLIWMTGGAIA